MNKSGIVDPEIMRPVIPERPNEALSILAEMAVEAAKQAIERWGKPVSEIGAVICAASNMQRPYPAMAIEIQQALGIEGFAFDMNVACSSATFGIKTAADFVTTGSAKAVLMVNPEICSGHLNFKDRDSHFIFGDVATAVIIEDAGLASDGWDILGARLKTQFSNNIRNNFGFLNRAAPEGEGARDKLFVQEGRKVFREVVPMVSQMILEHATDLGIDTAGLKRLWLHQANINMNEMIGRKVLGRDPAPGENVIILDEYANTSSAGSIIAFHQANDDFAAGAWGTEPERLTLMPPTIDRARRHPEFRSGGARERVRGELGVAVDAVVWLAVAAHPLTKGLDRAVAALPAFPDARLVVAGVAEGTKQGRLIRRLAGDAHVSERITLLGMRRDIPELMAAADLLVHPARVDTTGTAILEAVVNGLPVIATALCGYSVHVAAAQAGVVMPEPFGPGNLIEALRQASAPARRAQWSRNGADYGASHDLYSGLDCAADMIAGVTTGTPEP